MTILSIELAKAALNGNLALYHRLATEATSTELDRALDIFAMLRGFFTTEG